MELINSIIALFIIINGLIGNTICFIIFKRQKLSKLPIIYFLRAMCIFDSLSVLNYTHRYLRLVFNINIRTILSFLCKFLVYFVYSVGSVQGWILVFLSFERFLSIRFPRKFVFIHNKKFHMGMILFIYSYNLLYYIPYIIFYNVYPNAQSTNLTNQTLVSDCTDIDSFRFNILVTMDLFNSTIIPSILMLISTLMVIYVFYQSKAQMKLNKSDKKRINKSLMFTLTVILMNLIYLLFNLPITVAPYFSSDIDGSDLDWITYHLYYGSFSVQIYIYLASNRIFRREFLSIISLNKKNQKKK